MLWYINEQLVESTKTQGSSIGLSSSVESGVYVLSNLSIPAEVSNNNSIVKCIGLGNDTFVNSSTAFLQLQG